MFSLKKKNTILNIWIAGCTPYKLNVLHVSRNIEFIIQCRQYYNYVFNCQYAIDC